METYFKNGPPPPGPDPSKDISYYNNYKQKPVESLYERTFKVETSFNPKLHRDDRQHNAGMTLHKEISNKCVPTTTTAMYGRRPPLETTDRKHARINIINKEFYRNSGNVVELQN
eukprot:sb/3476690/